MHLLSGVLVSRSLHATIPGLQRTASRCAAPGKHYATRPRSRNRFLPISRTPRHYYARNVVLAGMLAMFARKRTEFRRSARRTLGSRAWIRLEGSFATRPCRVLDLSATGAR